jgi:hypothetical protein
MTKHKPEEDATAQAIDNQSNVNLPWHQYTATHNLQT